MFVYFSGRACILSGVVIKGGRGEAINTVGGNLPGVTALHLFTGRVLAHVLQRTPQFVHYFTGRSETQLLTSPECLSLASCSQKLTPDILYMVKTDSLLYSTGNTCTPVIQTEIMYWSIHTNLNQNYFTYFSTCTICISTVEILVHVYLHLRKAMFVVTMFLFIATVDAL